MNCIENDALNNSFIVVYICCHGNMFTEPLHSNNRRDINTDTQTDGRDL
jgi:hypothetical protein